MRLLLFDIDNTLIDSGGAGRAAMERAAEMLYNAAGMFDEIQLDGRTDRAIFNEVLMARGVEPPDLPAAFEAMHEAYLGILPVTLRERHGLALTGVEALLDALAREKAAFGLATGNTRRGAELKLRYYSLWERFPAGGFGDIATNRMHIVGDGIKALARAAGVAADPANTLVVGDTPMDVRSALDVGARCVAVATGTYPAQSLRDAGAYAVVEDMADTAKLLDLLLN